MVITFNILHIFGLAKPIATALNARKENKNLWSMIQWIGFSLALGLFVPLLILTANVFKGDIGPANPAVLFVPLLIIVELITIEVTAVAGWYREGRKLIRYPGGSWVMLMVS